MMKKIILLLIVGITTVFLASCSTSDPLISEAETNIKNENYDAALAAAEKSIQQNPQNPLGYYYKGVALGQKAADQENPEQATQLYVQMDDAFAQAKEKASAQPEAPDEIERIDVVRNGFWQEEHNQAVAYATEDSLKKTVNEPLDLAVAHLNNATTIQPDSALSWEVLAQIHNMREDYEKAAEAQQKFIEVKANPEAQSYLLLSQFYRLNEEPEKAAEVLENAREQYPDNIKIVEALADAYSQMGEAEKAIAIVEELVEKNPSNPQYRLSLGTRLYQAALEIQSSYDENLDQIFNLQQEMRNAQGAEAKEMQSKIDALQEKNAKLRAEIDELTDRAIVELNATVENRPDEPVAYNTLGIIYQNKAAVIFDQRNMTTDNQKAAELDKQAKALLKKAMTNYEKAAELDPDNQQYWRSLFQVYTALGMDEKAAEAEKKAGMQ
ncbi:MAG: tetratricopeptide repeat protein [Balneolaceae bacterium]|nr:tetratricopeptide repeat protein [Balneolaceae bacterium]